MLGAVSQDLGDHVRTTFKGIRHTLHGLLVVRWHEWIRRKFEALGVDGGGWGGGIQPKAIAKMQHLGREVRAYAFCSAAGLTLVGRIECFGPGVNRLKIWNSKQTKNKIRILRLHYDYNSPL